MKKFTEVGDPVHDMGIGDPLYIAGGKLEEFASKHGYDFEMVKISKKDSPVIYVPITPRFEIRTEFQGGGAICTIRFKYTITYMKERGWVKTPYSLRKIYMGYDFIPTIDEFLEHYPTELSASRIDYDKYEEWALETLKLRVKKGSLKEKALKQQLMGRFADVDEVIDRIRKNIKRETKN